MLYPISEMKRSLNVPSSLEEMRFTARRYNIPLKMSAEAVGK